MDILKKLLTKNKEEKATPKKKNLWEEKETQEIGDLVKKILREKK